MTELNVKIVSLAQLKRAINYPGIVIRVVDHWQENLKGSTRTPKAIRNSGKRGIQGNGYYFDGINHDGKPCELWAEIPPAKELKFNADGTVTFHPGQSKSWTLAFAAHSGGAGK